MVSNLPWGTAFWGDDSHENGSNMKPPTSPQNRWPIVPSCTLYTLGSGRRMWPRLGGHPRNHMPLAWCSQHLPTKPSWNVDHQHSKAILVYPGIDGLRHGFGDCWDWCFQAWKQTWDLAKGTPSSMSLRSVWLDQTLKMSESVTNFVKKLKGTFTNDPLSSRKNHGFPAFRRPHIIN